MVSVWVMMPFPAAFMKLPSMSEVNCQNMRPVFHPLQAKFFVMAAFRSAADIHPLDASTPLAGFPITILFPGTPAAMISFTEVPGHHPPDTLKRLWALSQIPTPWLQNCTLQKLIIEPTSFSTFRQPPLGQRAAPPKQGPWGAWVMMALGARLALRTLVRVMSQFSPLPSPLWKAAVSSQSMSTPSSWLSLTYLASLRAQSVGSTPAEVGFYVAPKALTSNLTPAWAQQLLMVAWICLVLDPQELTPMLAPMLAHNPAASRAPWLQVQKVRAMQLQGRGVLVKPGTPRAAGTAWAPHQEVRRLIYTNLMGTVELALLAALAQLILAMVSGKTPGRRQQRQRRAISDFTINEYYLINLKANPDLSSGFKPNPPPPPANRTPPPPNPPFFIPTPLPLLPLPPATEQPPYLPKGTPPSLTFLPIFHTRKIPLNDKQWGVMGVSNQGLAASWLSSTSSLSSTITSSPTKLMRDLMAVLQILPSWSEEYCQNITPVFHPVLGQLVAMAASSTAGSMYELEASPTVAGLPMTTLVASTPLATISLTEVPGAQPPETSKMSDSFWYMVAPWLQNWMLQNWMYWPTFLWTVRQPPLGQRVVSVVKQGAWGAWVMMALGGSFRRRVLVSTVSQFSPLPSPFWKAGVSSQSMSTPSNWLSVTNWASSVPTTVGSQPEEVGFSVAPKALMMSFTPAAAYLALRVL